MTEQKKLNTHIETQLLHNDRWAGIAHSASHQPVYKSVQFTYDSAQGIADAFQGKIAGYTYSRSNNPTLTALEAQLTLLEGGVETVMPKPIVGNYKHYVMSYQNSIRINKIHHKAS